MKFLISIVFSTLLFTLDAQSIGEWRLHFNYENSIDVVATPDKIYSANEDALLVYDKEDRTTRKFDKSNALSDIGVNALGYSSASNTVIVAYNSGNIDLIKGSTIINMPDIRNDISSGSKSINNVFVKNSIAYLSTDFGIVVVNLIEEEIAATFIIGSTGNQVRIDDLTIHQDTIYALTAEGLKRAALAAPNLLDFSSWEHNIANLPSQNLKLIETYNGFLYASSYDTLYKYNSAIWDVVIANDSLEILAITNSGSFGIIINDEEGFTLLRKQNNILDTLPSNFVLAPMKLIFENNDFYVSDFAFGLIKFSNGQRTFIRPSSYPFSSNAFRVSSSQDRVYVAGGAFNQNIDASDLFNDGFYIFRDNRWGNVNKFITPGYENNIQDIIEVKENPITGLVYAASMSGLLEYDFETIKLYNRENSPLEGPAFASSLDMITAIDFDRDGNIWMLNSQASKGLKVLTKEGNWYEYDLGAGAQKYFGLYIDNNDNKWFTLRGQGAFVFKEGADMANENVFDLINLTTNPNNGNLPNSSVNVITQDKSGAIWVGTNQGVGVFDCPQNIFDPTSPCRVSRRVRSTLDEYTEFLFDNDAVRAITVDGANRKWMGTESGVWLLDATGEEEIHSFNINNSPLPSNRINDFGINNQTGEVFIATEFGLASFGSDATQGAENHDELKAYPNPVRPDYSGVISITGLVEGSFVKITDTKGILVHEGFALGGKYVWNGNDFNGRRAKTGVYFIFSSNPDGTEKAPTKIAFVN